MKEFFYIKGIDVLFAVSYALGALTGLIIPFLLGKSKKEKGKRKGGEQ